MKIYFKNKYAMASMAVLPLLLVAILFSFRHTFRRIATDFYHPFLKSINLSDSVLDNSDMLAFSRLELASRARSAEAELMKLKVENELLRNLENENAELRDILSVGPPQGYICKYAEISIRDPLRWDETFSINQGEEAGIKPGSIVITFSVLPGTGRRFAVAGRVVSVSKHSSQVNSIINKKSAFGVFVKGENVPGIMGGGFSENSSFFFYVNYLPRDLLYQEGTEIVTSPLSQDIAPFLPVGKILRAEENISAGFNEFYKSVIAVPYADFKRLRFFVVLVKK